MNKLEIDQTFLSYYSDFKCTKLLNVFDRSCLSGLRRPTVNPNYFYDQDIDFSYPLGKRILYDLENKISLGYSAAFALFELYSYYIQDGGSSVLNIKYDRHGLSSAKTIFNKRGIVNIEIK